MYMSVARDTVLLKCKVQQKHVCHEFDRGQKRVYMQRQTSLHANKMCLSLESPPVVGKHSHFLMGHFIWSGHLLILRAGTIAGGYGVYVQLP